MSTLPASPLRRSLPLAGLLASSLACLCLTFMPAMAQQKSRMSGMKLSNDQPIQIESDKLEIKDPESKAIFTGNVKVVQGATTLQAGNMVVYYKSGGGSISGGNAEIDRIEVDNKVFLQSGTQQATADSGQFNMAAQTLVLKGKQVVLSEGKNVFSGCQLNVHMETGEAQLDSCGGRVQIQLDPKSQKTN